MGKIHETVFLFGDVGVLYTGVQLQHCEAVDITIKSEMNVKSRKICFSVGLLRFHVTLDIVC